MAVTQSFFLRDSRSVGRSAASFGVGLTTASFGFAVSFGVPASFGIVGLSAAL